MLPNNLSRRRNKQNLRYIGRLAPFTGLVKSSLHADVRFLGK